MSWRLWRIPWWQVDSEWPWTFGLVFGVLRKLENENETGFVSCLWKARSGDVAASVRSLNVCLLSGLSWFVTSDFNTAANERSHFTPLL